MLQADDEINFEESITLFGGICQYQYPIGAIQGGITNFYNKNRRELWVIRDGAVTKKKCGEITRSQFDATPTRDNDTPAQTLCM